MLDKLYILISKNPKNWILIIALAILSIAGVVFSLAYLINSAMDSFGADWTNFWGWVALILAAPIAKAWIVGNKK